MLKKLSIILVLIAAHFCRNICGSLTPPIIDISALITPESYSKAEFITTQQVIINACQEWGFFHIINHGISIDLEDSLVQQMKLFFMSDKDIKNSVKRSPTNSRGFADDELTKQLKDSKEILDIGQVHFSNLSMKALKDQSLDGVNMWPVADHLNQLKPVVDAYYDACMNLAGVIFKAITSQLACQGELPSSVSSAFETHSSFLRLNMYPIVSDVLSVEVDGSVSSTPSSNLGVSRHTDAGVLTLLLQDSVPALEVYSGSKQDFGDGEWVAVDPVPRALTINTGDMLQVWSNGLFKAPEHRVRASRSTVRYSAPFFYNPAYDTQVAPVLCDEGVEEGRTDTPRYSPIRWGDYRTQRFIGDYRDAGEEIQIEVFSN